MATFIIKNLSSNVSVTVFGNKIMPFAKLDLLTVATGAQIISSMRTGELYQLLMGRMVAVADMRSFHDLGATTDDLDFFAYCGFMQGNLGSDDLKYPFKFSSDGYLLSSISSISSDGYIYVGNNLSTIRSNSPVALINSPQNFSQTPSWGDLGSEIDVRGMNRISLWLSVTKNDGYDMDFRMLAKHTFGGSEEYLIPLLKQNTTASPYSISAEDGYIEFNVDASQLMVLTWDISNTYPYVQFQQKANTTNTLPQIASAYITYGWGS